MRTIFILQRSIPIDHYIFRLTFQHIITSRGSILGLMPFLTYGTNLIETSSLGDPKKSYETIYDHLRQKLYPTRHQTVISRVVGLKLLIVKLNARFFFGNFHFHVKKNVLLLRSFDQDIEFHQNVKREHIVILRDLADAFMSNIQLTM